MATHPARWDRERKWREALFEVEDEIASLEHQARVLDEEVARLRRIRDALHGLVRSEPGSTSTSASLGGVVSLYPLSAAVPEHWAGRDTWASDGPTTAQAIVEVLRVAGRPMRPREILSELEVRGWMPERVADPARLVSATLSRLHANRRAPIRRQSQAQYAYVTD